MLSERFLIVSTLFTVVHFLNRILSNYYVAVFTTQCHIGLVVRMSILDAEVDGSNPSISMFSPRARDFIRIASVDSAVK